MGSFVEFQNVSKIYKTGEVSIQALHDVNFQIEKSEFCVIVGASGAGSLPMRRRRSRRTGRSCWTRRRRSRTAGRSTTMPMRSLRTRSPMQSGRSRRRRRISPRSKRRTRTSLTGIPISAMPVLRSTPALWRGSPMFFLSSSFWWRRWSA